MKVNGEVDRNLIGNNYGYDRYKGWLIPMVRIGLNRIISRFHNEKSGITGLETAIVLIAFVVVAAVFAFTVLTTGLFTSEKAKETALAGVATTSSSLTVKGNIIATGTIPQGQTPPATAPDTVDVIRVKIATATGVERVPFDPEKLIITYLDENNVGQFTFPPLGVGNLNAAVDGPAVQARVDACQALAVLTWCYVQKGPDLLLDPGEVHELYLFVSELGTGNVGAKLEENTKFTIEIIPQDGAVVKVDKRTPLSLSATMNLN